MKLLATDYDGTLRYAQDVMPEDLKSIAAWKEQGNKFVIVTGRSKESIDAQVQAFDLPCDYLITNNGGMVFDENGNVLLSNFLNFDVCVDILHNVKKLNSVISYVVNDGIHRHRIVLQPDAVDHRYPNLKPDVTETELLDMSHFAQIVLSMEDTDSALEVASKINDLYYEQVVAYPNNFVVDIVPKGISKATGLDFLIAYANINEEDVYTIGDGHNDIPLIEFGVHGSVMSYADADVKMHAQVEYDSVSDLISKNM